MSPEEIEQFTKRFSERFEALWKERFGDDATPRASWTSETIARFDAEIEKLRASIAWLYSAENRSANQRLQWYAELQKNTSAQNRLVPAFDRNTEELLTLRRVMSEFKAEIELRDRTGQSELSKVSTALTLSTAQSARTEEVLRTATAALQTLKPKHSDEEASAHATPSRFGFRELKGIFREYRLMSTTAKLILVLLVALAVAVVGGVYLLRDGNTRHLAPAEHAD